MQLDNKEEAIQKLTERIDVLCQSRASYAGLGRGITDDILERIEDLEEERRLLIESLEIK